MASVTLATLTARARERADMVGSLFVTDVANSLWGFVNEGVQELHELLITSFGSDYSVSSSALTTVAGTSSYNLPSDFLKLLGIDFVLGGATYSLKKFVFAERNTYKALTHLSWNMALPRYRVEGSVLRFYPAPDAVYSGTLWYAPTTPLLANSADTVNFPNGWERFVVLHAAICCLKKEESDASSLEREKATLRQHIIETAANRDAGAPEQTVDVEVADTDLFWF